MNWWRIIWLQLAAGLGKWRRGYDLHDDLGRKGEDLAARYVRKKLGMKILGRNILCPGGELDLVALSGEHLVFVEVRTLHDEGWQRPEMTVRSEKRHFLARSARWFIRSRRLDRFIPRGDLIAIVWAPEGQGAAIRKPEIRYYRGAWAIDYRRRK